MPLNSRCKSVLLLRGIIYRCHRCGEHIGRHRFDGKIITGDPVFSYTVEWEGNMAEQVVERPWARTAKEVIER